MTEPAPAKDRLSLADFDPDRLPPWARGTARRVQAFGVRNQDHVLVAMVQRFLAILGTDRALAIGAHAFVAVVPLVMLITSKITLSTGDSWMTRRLINAYNLHGEAATAVRNLFNPPAGAPHQGWFAFVLSVLISVITALAFTRAMQRTFEAAWGLTSLGLRGQVFGLTGIAALMAELLLLALVRSLLSGVPASGFLELLFRLVGATLFWLIIAWLLLGKRIDWRRLLPGAIVSGVGTVLVQLGSGVYMPRVIETNAVKYGAIGVTFALLTWLYVLGVVLVAGAVAGAELGGARRVRRKEFIDS